MKFTLILLFLFSFCFPSNGQTTLKELYEDNQYELIIKILNKKKNLNHEELGWLARSHGRIGEFSNGLMYSEELMDKCINANDTFNLVRAINVKTENLVDLIRYEEGLEFCEANTRYFRAQDSAEYQLLCFKLGMIYFYLEKYEACYDTYNQITMPEFHKGTLFKTNYSLALMGVGKFDKAIVYLNKSLREDESGNADVSNYHNIALIFMLQDRWDEAKVYLDSSLIAANESGILMKKKVVYRNFYDFYSNTDELILAREYLDSVAIMNEQMFNEKLDEELVALKTSFKREHSLEKKIVTVDNKLAYSQKIRLRGVIIFLISMLVLFGVIAFLWIRNIKSQNQNILIEQKLLRSQMTPHFMFNSLAILQGIILNKEYKKSINYLSKFSKLLRITLENSRDKVVPLENEIKAIENYIIVQNLGTEDNFKCTIEIDESIDQETLLIPPMMIQPFIENAIEHGFPIKKENQEISVKIQFEEEDLTCFIADNGIGLAQTRVINNVKKKSLATTITTERLKMLSKEFKVKTGISIVDRKVNNVSGTIVSLILPYQKIPND